MSDVDQPGSMAPNEAKNYLGFDFSTQQVRCDNKKKMFITSCAFNSITEKDKFECVLNLV